MPHHTPGPWTTYARYDCTEIRTADHEHDVACVQATGGPSEADAARIVACVNALEGIADPAAVAELIAAAQAVANAPGVADCKRRHFTCNLDNLLALRAALAALGSSK